MKTQNLTEDEVKARKLKVWENWNKSYRDVTDNLKPKYFKMMDCLFIVLEVCPANCILHYVKAACTRTTYFLERYNLLYDGKCCEEYQVTDEQDFLLSPTKYKDMVTFARNGEDQALMDGVTVKALTLRSYKGIQFSKAANSIQRLELDMMGIDIETTKINVFRAFQTDLHNALWRRDGIKNSTLVFLIRFEHKVCVQFTAQFLASTTLVTEETVWQTAPGHRFRSKSNKFDEIIKSSYLSAAYHPVTKEILYAHETELPETFPSVKKKKDTAPPPMEAPLPVVSSEAVKNTNLQHGVGSHRLVKTSSNRNSAAAASPTVSFEDDCAMSPQQPDVDRLVSTDGLTTPHMSSGGIVCSDNEEVIPGFRSVRSRKRQHTYNSNLLNSDDASWCQDSSSSVSSTEHLSTTVDSFKVKKRKQESEEEEEEEVDNGEEEEGYRSSSYKKRPVRQKSCSSFASPNNPDEDFTPGSTSTSRERNKSSSKQKKNKQTILAESIANKVNSHEKGQLLRNDPKRDFAMTIDLTYDEGVIATGGCLVSLKDRSQSQQALGSPPLSFASPYVHIKTETQRNVINRQLDYSFVSFLLYHTTSTIGAELAMERVVVDYMTKKVLLNNVKSVEGEVIVIRNWRPVFIGIESLILDQIDSDSAGKKDTFNRAFETSISLINRDLISRQTLLADSRESMSDCEYQAASDSCRELYDSQEEELKLTVASMVGLIEKANASVRAKVIRTIHNVARKVCYMWAKFNDCLDVFTTKQLATYSSVCEAQENMHRMLEFCEEHNSLFLSARIDDSGNTSSSGGMSIMTASPASVVPILRSSTSSEKNIIHVEDCIANGASTEDAELVEDAAHGIGADISEGADGADGAIDDASKGAASADSAEDDAASAERAASAEGAASVEGAAHAERAASAEGAASVEGAAHNNDDRSAELNVTFEAGRAGEFAASPEIIGNTLTQSIFTTGSAISSEKPLTLSQEQTHLVEILKKNHVRQLEGVIRDMKVDKLEMKMFVELVFEKGPREKFSAPLDSAKKKALKKTSATAAAASAAGLTTARVFPPLDQAQAKASANNLASWLEGASPDKSHASPPASGSPASDSDESHSVSTSFDGVIRLLMLSLCAVEGDYILQLYHKYKSDRLSMLVRLKFLHFLMSHKSKSADEVMSLFAHSASYSIFTCGLWMKGERADGGNITADGFCGYRTKFQAYERVESNYALSVDSMVASDAKCNNKDNVSSPENKRFNIFMQDFHSHMQNDQELIQKIGEVKHFKLHSDARIVATLLKVRNGQSLPHRLWSNQADIALMNFNVSSWEKIKPECPIAKYIPERSNYAEWLQFKNSSVDMRLAGVPSLSALDALCQAVPNFVCFNNNHFFIIGSPTQEVFLRGVEALKTALMQKLLDGISLIAEASDFTEQLERVIDAIESGAENTTPMFDLASFATLFTSRFPRIDAPSQSHHFVDLLHEGTVEESSEINILKNKLSVSEEKVLIKDYHVNVLMDLLED